MQTKTLTLQNISRQQLYLGGAVFITLSLLALLTFSVIHHGFLTAFNTPVLHFFQKLDNQTLSNIMFGITTLGNLRLMVALMAVVTGYILWRRQWWLAGHCVGHVMLTFGSVWFLKNWVHSPRPNGLWLPHKGWSFPSAHTTLSVAIFGFIAVLIAKNVKASQRWIPYLCTGVLAGSVAVSRLYFSVHWLTDVIGGFLLGSSIIMLTHFSYSRREIARINVRAISLLVFFTIIVAWSWVFTHYPQRLLNFYLSH